MRIIFYVEDFTQTNNVTLNKNVYMFYYYPHKGFEMEKQRDRLLASNPQPLFTKIKIVLKSKINLKKAK